MPWRHLSNPLGLLPHSSLFCVNPRVHVAAPNDDSDGRVIRPARSWNPLSQPYNSTTDVEPAKGYRVASVQDCTMIL